MEQWLRFCRSGEVRARRVRMIELLRTNDPVLISYVEALLKGEGVGFFVADQHMSVLEGSLGFIRRRIMVLDEDSARARRMLEEAGLGSELSRA